MTTTNQVISEQEQLQQKNDIPAFRPGDSLRVAVRVREGGKERIQNFEGVCIRRKGSGLAETITVRRVSFGVGIERIFPLHSPRIESISVTRAGRVRRAKLYYLRERQGKAARIPDLSDKPGRGTKLVRVAAEGKPRRKRGAKAKAERRARRKTGESAKKS